MNQIPSTPRTSYVRNKTLSFDDLTGLFNILPEAAFVCDLEQSILTATNSALLKLTAFSKNEIQRMSVSALLPELDFNNLAVGAEIETKLCRRKRDPVEVVVKCRSFDASKQYRLITLVPLDEFYNDPLQDYDLLINGLLSLTEIGKQEDFQSFLDEIVKTVYQLLNVDYICIYRAQSSVPVLEKSAYKENKQEVFPNQIASMDLSRLGTTAVWIPGQRIFTEIHRAARIGNLTYVASTPIGSDGAFVGLLVVGDDQQQPKERLSSILDFIGAQISTTWQHFMLIDHLRSANASYADQISTYQRAFENASEGLVIVDHHLKVKKLNETAELMFGYTDAEVVGQTVDNLLIGAEGLLPSLEAALEGKTTPKLGPTNLHRRDGQSFPSEIRIYPINDIASDNILVYINDISEHEQIKIQTQQLEHRAFLGEFMAIFAHEVRNPINNISTGLQLLESRFDEGNQNLELVDHMQTDCARLLQLMESVLASSQPLAPKMKPMDVGILINRIISRWRPRLARVKVEPVIKIEENLPMIMGDPRSLEQVFTNLISNAVEAMSKNGGILAISLNTSNVIRNKKHVEIIVSDNGPGIPEEVCKRIFEPFVTTNPKGNGLGLAITKRIITAHRGSISLNSFPGGTMFHVFIPTLDGGV
jgi:PAS domain S-box-containing protein